MSDLALSIRLTADGKDLVGAVKVSAEELDKLGGATKRVSSEAEKLNAQHKNLGETLNGAARAAEQHLQALRKQAETYGMTAMQVRAYEASRVMLTQSQRDEAAGLILQIGAQERYGAALNRVKGYVIAAGAAVAAYAGSLILSVKHTIDQAAALQTLSEKTGIAVERLAGLKYAAEVSDTTVQSLARAMARLPRSLIEGANPNSEAGRAFGFLGIDPASLHTQEQAIDAIANAIRRVEDPMAKSAALQMIFKRNGEELIPLFNQGADGIRRLTVEGERWNSITGETAQQAKYLKDQLVTVEYASGAFARSIAKDVLPVLNSMIEKFLEARTRGDGFFKSLASAWMPSDKTLDIARERVIEGTDKILAAETEISRLQAARGSMIPALIAQQQKILDGARAQVTEAQQYIKLEEAAGRQQAGPPIRGLPEARPAGKGEGEDPMRSIIKTLREKLLLDRELTEVNKLQITLQEMSEKQRAKVTQSSKEEAEQLARKVDLNKLLKEQMENDAKNENALTKMRQEGAEAAANYANRIGDAILATDKSIEQMKFETNLIGMTNGERETAIALRAMETAGINTQSDAYTQLAARLKEAITAKNVREEAAAAWTNLWSTVEGTGKQVWSLLTAGGENMATSVGKALKAATWDLLYQLTAKKWFLQIGAGVSGSLGMTSGAQAASGSMLGNAAGSLMSNMGLSSLFGSGVGGLGGAMGAGIMTAAPVYEAGALVSAGTSASLFSGAGASAAMAAIPGWGWAALGAAAIGAYILNSGDGDAQRTGNWAANLGQPGRSPNNRWFDASTGTGPLTLEMAAQEQKIADTLALTADQLATVNAALAAQSGTQFGFGMEHTDWTQSGAAQAIAAARLKTISEALGTSVEGLAQKMADAQKVIDLAPQKLQLEIDLMKAQGNAAGALAAERKRELAALDPTLQALKQQIYAAEDLANAANDATGAIDSLTQKLSDIRKEADTAIDAQIQASRSAGQAARSAADSYRSLTASLSDAVTQLRGGALSPLLPGQKLAEARAQLGSVYSQAATGDAAALAKLPQTATAFLEASRAYNASSEAYTADFDMVMKLLGQAGVASTASANWQDYQATLLQAQTGVLEKIKAQLDLPSPDAAILREQVDMLKTISGLLQQQTTQIITGNGILTDQNGNIVAGNVLVHDQTGQIIGSNFLIGDQTGKITLGNSLLGNQVSAFATAAAIAQAQAGQVIGVVAGGNALTVDQLAQMAAGNAVLNYQTGQLAAVNAGQGVVQTLLNGQTVQIVGGNLIQRDQSGLLLSSNEILLDQAGKLSLGNSLVGSQTNQIITGNATQDAIKNLSRTGVSYSEQMLAELVSGSGVQSSSLEALVGGNAKIADLLSQLVKYQDQVAMDAWNASFEAAVKEIYASTGTIPVTSQQRMYDDATEEYYYGTVTKQVFDLAAFDAAVAAWRAAHPVPGHAAGGMASGWSMVGELGPELVHFGAPGRVYTADQTRAALGDGVSKEDIERLITAVKEAKEAILRASDLSDRIAREQTAQLTAAVEDSARGIGRTVARTAEAGTRV